MQRYVNKFPNVIKSASCFDVTNRDHSGQNFAHAKGGADVVTCKILWPDCIISIMVTAKRIFTRCWVWANKPSLILCVPVTRYGRKPQSAPPLTFHYRVSVAFTWLQFHSECPSYCFVWWIWNYNFKIIPTSLRGQWYYLLLLISMLWHRQAIFESKGDTVEV